MARVKGSLGGGGNKGGGSNNEVTKAKIQAAKDISAEAKKASQAAEKASQAQIKAVEKASSEIAKAAQEIKAAALKSIQSGGNKAGGSNDKDSKKIDELTKIVQQLAKQQYTEDCLVASSIRDVQHGADFCVVEPVNLYECCFGRGVFVGPFVEIQSDVIIGDYCRIQSHSFICSLTRIGNGCFIGHGVMFVNDLFKEGKPSEDKKQWRGARVGNNVSIGSNATILPINICDNVVIGAGSVVTKDITQEGIYAGNPAKKLRGF